MLTISAAPSYSIPGQNSPDPKDNAAKILLQGLPPNGAFREKQPGTPAECDSANRLSACRTNRLVGANSWFLRP